MHPDAIVIGDVTIGAFSSIWPGAVLRGDFSSITVGERTSIQDGAIIHVGQNKPTTVIGNDTVVGHLVHLEGCTIGNKCLIGVGSIVRHGCVVENESIVGAHAMVRDNTTVPTGFRALGLPAKVEKGNVDLSEIERIVQMYIENSKMYKHNLRTFQRRKMQVLRESLLEQLGFGKQNLFLSIQMMANTQLRQKYFGKITVTFKSKTPRPKNCRC
ncbi:MAG: gamma carbonic anhydrase family protein [Acidimicrobiia bacterium]